MALPPRSGWLIAGAAASFALVVLVFAVIVIGAPAYTYFLAPAPLVALAAARSLVATVMAGVLAGVFALFGTYALAGAGLLHLPATRILVAAIGCIYTLRGLIIVPEMIMVRFLDLPARALIFSAVSLLIGVVHLIGVARRWQLLAPAAGAD